MSRIRVICITLAILTSIMSVPVEASNEGKTYALVVNSMTSENAACQGVVDMIKVVGKNKYYNKKKKLSKFFYNCENRKLGTDGKKYKKAIKKAFSGAGKSDYGFFYHIGHGRNLISNGFELSTYWGDFITFKAVAKQLAATKCRRIVVVLDSCHSGAFITRGLSGLSQKDKERFIVFAACQPNQTAKYSKNDVAYFSNAVAYGLLHDYKKVDKNKSKNITVKELKVYVKKVMSEYNIKQTPKVYASNENLVIYQYR